ncbi:hydrogen gas-evolving membrane-bound hydrogenase subunit E [Rhodococcus sp. 3Y1]
MRRVVRAARRTRPRADPVPRRDTDTGDLRARARKFPAEVDESKAIGFKWPRAALAVAVGITVTTIAAFATNARNTRPIYELLPDAAYDLGNGKNVVNVLLVDIRAWDTLGEISVLLVAATGVASLVFRNRRFGIAPRVADAPPSSSTRQLPTRTRRGCAAETSSILDTVRWFSRSPRG